MPDPIPAMQRAFGLSPMGCYLLLTVPRWHFGAAGGGTTWNRQTVRAELLASLQEDDADQTEVEALIGRLHAINLTHVGWFVLGVKAMRPVGEVIARPSS
jgi:hypothetical protein